MEDQREMLRRGILYRNGQVMRRFGEAPEVWKRGWRGGVIRVESIKAKSVPIERDRRDEISHGFRENNKVRRIIEDHVSQCTLSGAIGYAPAIPVKNF